MSTTPSGQISARDIELVMNDGLSTHYPGGTSRLTFNDSLVRTLAGKPTTTSSISMDDMRNKAGPTAYGTVLSSYCSGSTLIESKADGNYGTYGVNTPNSNLCERLFFPSTTNLVVNYQMSYNEGGRGENFFRTTGVTPASLYRGQVWVNYFLYAQYEKQWDLQLVVGGQHSGSGTSQTLTGGRVIARSVMGGGSYYSAVEWNEELPNYGQFVPNNPGPWLAWSGVVDINVGEEIRGWSYLWGSYGSDHIEGGFLQVGAVTN